LPRRQSAFIARSLVVAFVAADGVGLAEVVAQQALHQGQIYRAVALFRQVPQAL
jgi:uncharacterized membrane protein (DUF441 family)